MTTALSGIRVVEVGRFVSAPMASVLLADLGAEVIKVEQPNGGDPFRRWATGGGYSPAYRSLNRNKKSLAIDITTARGLELLLQLTDNADVLIENFRVGQPDEWGWGYEALKVRNHRLVYCSISGFGTTGPYKDRPGYDTVGQAMSGLLSVLTDLDAPQPVGINLSDNIAGIYAAYGILGALMARERTGTGQRVDTSLLQSAISFQSENVSEYFESGISPMPRLSSISTGRSPTREQRSRSAGVWALVARDGKPLVIHLSILPKFWENLTNVVGHAEWAKDPRFVDLAARRLNYLELREELRRVFLERNREEWLQALVEADVPCSPINNLEEVFEDPQVKALKMQRTLAHPVMGNMELAGPPVNLSETPISWNMAPPVLGEHSHEVLRGLGCSEVEIKELAKAGITRLG